MARHAARVRRAGTDDTSPLDPGAVERAYRRERARRRARDDRRRRTRHAGRRFWLTLVVILVAALVVAVATWQEIQRLFGL